MTSLFNTHYFPENKATMLTLTVVGQQGDYTWRYRIWQFFQQNGIDVEMVGPYKGTVRTHPY